MARSAPGGRLSSVLGPAAVPAFSSLALHVAAVALVMQAAFRPAEIARLPAMHVTLLSEDALGSVSTPDPAPLPEKRARPRPPQRSIDGNEVEVVSRQVPDTPEAPPSSPAVAEVPEGPRPSEPGVAAPMAPPPPPPPKPVRTVDAPGPVGPPVESTVAAMAPEFPPAPPSAEPVEATSTPPAPPVRSAVAAPEAPKPAAIRGAGVAESSPPGATVAGLVGLLPDYDKGAPASAGGTEETDGRASRVGAILAGNPPPEYPPLARRRGIEGRVVLGVSLVSDGRPQSVWVVASSGHGILDWAAAKAVRKWRFVAARRRGAPVASSIEVPVTFRLED